MNIERLMNVMIEEKTSLNNLFMAGLGASTLILRLGAIIQLSKKLKEGTPKEDALLIKQIVENNKASFAFPSSSIYIEKK